MLRLLPLALLLGLCANPVSASEPVDLAPAAPTPVAALGLLPTTTTTATTGVERRREQATGTSVAVSRFAVGRRLRIDPARPLSVPVAPSPVSAESLAQATTPASGAHVAVEDTTRRFAVRDSERPEGTVTEVLLDAAVVVVPFVESYRESAGAACRAGGRLLTGTAGVALRAGDDWDCRMQMTRQALHSFAGENLGSSYSVELRRRF